ncbi:MAG TPA: UvrD-helicase domain-containing protein [Burkholderiaceae bacterium]|nr:UvrD-helicase domain-containing protein [Burkholderiaceae bacterium]
MNDYLADGVPVDELAFVRRACEPMRSAAVEACAGSGKTWLLVSRVIRALLAGAAPGEILAITFTRRAAQEMHERLLRELRLLAAAETHEVAAALEARGLSASEAQQSVGAARQLFERVTTARVPMTVETFHGWFWRLVSRAPLGAGVPFAPTLLEASDRTRANAWLHFLAALLQPQREGERRAWEFLLDELGEATAGELLRNFLHKRAEWWSFAAADADTARERVLETFGAETADPGTRVRDAGFVEAVRALVDLWRATAPTPKAATHAIDRAKRWLGRGAGDVGADLRAACCLLLTREMSPIVALTPERLAARLGAAAAERYAALHARLVDDLDHVLAERRTWRARRVNAAGVACGTLLVACYQSLKEREHVVDFTDLEWHALRLLSDPDHAAYMQARLDARYRHILIDEFQDTNALQWRVLQSWLAAYGPSDGTADDRPSVFIVGDPKQSIYRFRRAEPRVFQAAVELLQQDFAGCHLRTNVTQRSAEAIVAMLNATMSGNALYQPQWTRVPAADCAGAFVLLPLAEPTLAADVQATELRDVLTTPRVEAIDDACYREGLAFANEIRSWRHRIIVTRGESRPVRWSDVLVLVRRRNHLPEYERALRDAGVPYVSDRRGGLLATLEADDLMALLQFLITPGADLKLAHALRSPLFACSDDDLIGIAAASGRHWWERLAQLTEVSTALDRARSLLQGWMALAGVLPVHDLLDRIYFEGDARRRYAAVVPPALQSQVQANLDAFIELALEIDAGRFPSLSRFIDELALLKQQGGDEAPDEGATGGNDAVRVLTIHGAKGLEAEIVVLADAHSTAARDRAGVLVSWSPEDPAPEHLSLFVQGDAARDPARAAWFAADDAQREQEDWNLLYVAATRARQVFIVSGSRPRRNGPASSWYTTLQAAAALAVEVAPAEPESCVPTLGRVRDFLPQPLPAGRRREEAENSEAARLGRAWHAMLEATDLAAVESIAQVHGLDRPQALAATLAASRVRATWPQFFAPGSAAELDIVAADGSLFRLDRLVETEEALWILDFKWRVSDAERERYAAQVRGYGEVLRAVRRDKPVRLALVSADAELIEVS